MFDLRIQRTHLFERLDGGGSPLGEGAGQVRGVLHELRQFAVLLHTFEDVFDDATRDDLCGVFGTVGLEKGGGEGKEKGVSSGGM